MSNKLHPSSEVGERERIEAQAEELAGSHFWNDDDGWYSCPLSPDGCLDPKQSGCTCGRDARRDRILTAFAALASKLETAREALRKIAEVGYNRLDAEQGELSEHIQLAEKALASLSPQASPDRKP